MFPSTPLQLCARFTLPLTLGCLLLVLSAPTRAMAQSETPRAAKSAVDARAEERVDAMLAFLGGADARDQVRSLSTSAECRGPDGEFTTLTKSVRPELGYFEQTSDRGTTQLWSLPQRTWSRAADGTLVDVPAQARGFVRGHEFHLQLLDLRLRFTGFTVAGSEDIDGKSAQRIAMQDEDGNPASLLIADDGRPVEMVMNPPGAAGAIRIVYHVWKERDGVRWFRGFTLTEGTDREFLYRYTSIETNNVESKWFERPN